MYNQEGIIVISIDATQKSLLTFGTFPKWVWKSICVLNSVAAKHVVACSSHLHLQVHYDIYLRTEGNFWSIQGQFPHLMYQFFRGQSCKISLISLREAVIFIAFILENIWWKFSPWPLLKKEIQLPKFRMAFFLFFVWLFVCLFWHDIFEMESISWVGVWRLPYFLQFEDLEFDLTIKAFNVHVREWNILISSS